MNIGERLRRLRKERQLSLEEMAQQSELDCTYIGKIETGHQIPPIEALERIAKVLGVPPYQIFYDGETPPTLSNLTGRKLEDEIASGSVTQDISFKTRFRARKHIHITDGDN